MLARDYSADSAAPDGLGDVLPTATKEQSAILNPHSTQGRGNSQKVLAYSLLMAVTFFLYARCLRFQFVWDDEYYVLTNYRIQALAWVRLRAIWTGPFLGLYAPIQHSFLAFIYRLLGARPLGFHLAQLLLHAACVGVLYGLLAKMESGKVALLAAALFAAHPANVETVVWISETKSTLAFLFFLLSFWSFIRLRERNRRIDGVLCGLFLILSLLSKINTAVTPAIFLLYDYKQGHLTERRRLWSLAIFFLISAAFVGIHLAVFHNSPQIPDIGYQSPSVHLLNLPLILGFYIRLLIFPNHLSAWEAFPAQQHFGAIAALGWAGLLALAWVIYRSSREQQFWELWFIVFLLPVLHLVPFPMWVADRYLYIPAIGGFVLAAHCFFRVLDRLQTPSQRWAWRGIAIAVVALLGLRTWEQVPVWRDNVSLWEATTPTCNASAYCHDNLGLALLSAGETQRGGEELVRAVQIRPEPQYLVNLGDAFSIGAGDYSQAIRAYRQALRIAQNGRGIGGVMGGGISEAEVYARLARAYIWAGDLPQAAQALSDAERDDRLDLTVLTAKAFLLWKQGRLEDARKPLLTALLITGTHSGAAAFFSKYWGNASEVDRLLADIRAQESHPTAHESTKTAE